MEVHAGSCGAAAEYVMGVLGEMALTDEEADSPVDGGELGETGQSGPRRNRSKVTVQFDCTSVLGRIRSTVHWG